MKETTLQTKLLVYDGEHELPEMERELLSCATHALKHAYAPYSNFKVGAAILLDNGEIVTGSNQENAAYSMCLCAERVALSVAAAEYPGQVVKKIAVTVRNEKRVTKRPVSPCGACRQSLAEVEYRQGDPIDIIMRGQEGVVYVVRSAEGLLPLTFDPSFL
jgi:cytidine deaminase